MAEESFVINPSNDNTKENFDVNASQDLENVQPIQNENVQPSNEQMDPEQNSSGQIENASIEEKPIETNSGPIDTSEPISDTEPSANEANSQKEDTTTEVLPNVVNTEATQDSQKTSPKHSEHHKSSKVAKPQIDQEVLNKLKELKESHTVINAKVEDRVNGGLRLNYEGVPIFLPISHFSFLDVNQLSEEDLIRTVGDFLEVEILEVNDDAPAHKRNIIASRKNVLDKKFFSELKVGTVVEGTVSSIPNFGVFLDIGGIEGLVHISRISRKHIDDPHTMFKKGDKAKAVVVAIDPDKKKISLSIADLEKSNKPNINLAEKYPVNSIHKAIVKRFVDFGVFVELEEGIDGLIRNPELSWTQRVNNPREVLKSEQEIQVQVISINPDKNLISLSYRNTLENPWDEIEKNIKIGDLKEGKIKQIRPEGAIVTIENDIDGFLPKSRMKNSLRNGKIPFKNGDSIQVKVADLIPSQHSLIFEILSEEKQEQTGQREFDNSQRHNRRQSRSNEERQVSPMLISESQPNSVGSFSIAELLDEQVKKLFDNNN